MARLARRLATLTAKLGPIESKVTAAEKAFEEIKPVYFNAVETLNNAYAERSALLNEMERIIKSGGPSTLAGSMALGVNDKAYDLLHELIDELGLTKRTANCLKAENICYVGELVQKNEAELMQARNVGQKSFDEIKNALTARGLRLGMNLHGVWPPPGTTSGE